MPKGEEESVYGERKNAGCTQTALLWDFRRAFRSGGAGRSGRAAAHPFPPGGGHAGGGQLGARHPPPPRRHRPAAHGGAPWRRSGAAAARRAVGRPPTQPGGGKLFAAPRVVPRTLSPAPWGPPERERPQEEGGREGILLSSSAKREWGSSRAQRGSPPPAGKRI